jgi:hypothetical protein
MPGLNVPAQMFDHELNVVKGWPSPYAVDKSATLAAGETGITAGMVVSLNAAGSFVRGLSDANKAVPCFAFPNQQDYDVMSDVGNVTGGHLMAIPALTGYEMETTEFVTGETYAPNQELTVENVDADDKGKITPGAYGTNLICGIVSDGDQPRTNDHRKEVVRFWGYFLPVLS